MSAPRDAARGPARAAHVAMRRPRPARRRDAIGLGVLREPRGQPRRCTATATRRCCAPSCRLRSSRRRSASPALTIRAVAACSSAPRVQLRLQARGLAAPTCRSPGTAPARRGGRESASALARSSGHALRGTAATSSRQDSASSARTSSSVSSPAESKRSWARGTGSSRSTTTRADRPQHLAQLALGQHGAEHAGARPDHGGRLAAQGVVRERPRCPVERVLELRPGSTSCTRAC